MNPYANRGCEVLNFGCIVNCMNTKTLNPTRGHRLTPTGPGVNQVLRSWPFGLGPLPNQPEQPSKGMQRTSAARACTHPQQPLPRCCLATPGHGKPSGMPGVQPPCGGLSAVDGLCWPWASMGRLPRGVGTG